MSFGCRLLRGASGFVEGGHIVTAQGDGEDENENENDDDDQGGASGIISISSISRRAR